MEKVVPLNPGMVAVAKHERAIAFPKCIRTIGVETRFIGDDLVLPIAAIKIVSLDELAHTLMEEIGLLVDCDAADACNIQIQNANYMDALA